MGSSSSAYMEEVRGGGKAGVRGGKERGLPFHAGSVCVVVAAAVPPSQYLESPGCEGGERADRKQAKRKRVGGRERDESEHR